jgi:hypothetical protein
MFAMFLSLVPRRIFMMIAALLMTTTLGVSTGLRLNGDIAIGEVREIVPLADDRMFLRIQLPFAATAKPVVAAEAAVRGKQITTGDWLLVSGSTVQIEGRALFAADTVVTSLDVSLRLRALVGNWEERLREAPFVAVLIGCAVLVAGNLLVTVATALLFAALCVILVWAATATTAFASWITVPPLAIYPIAVTAVVTGLVLGWKIADKSGSLCQRLLAAACVFALLPNMMARFGWPEAVCYGLLIASAALPAVAYSLVGALFLVIGLNARDNATLVILAISGCTVLIVQFRSLLSSAGFATPAPKGTV